MAADVVVRAARGKKGRGVGMLLLWNRREVTEIRASQGFYK